MPVTRFDVRSVVRKRKFLLAGREIKDLGSGVVRTRHEFDRRQTEG